jgi:capsular exopolysaccharide synthesis family protein
MDEFLSEQQFEESEPIDVMRYIRGIVKRWWLIAGCFVIGSVIGYFEVKNDKPMYEATAWLSFDEIQVSIPEHLIQNRIAKLRSRSFAEEATAKLGLTLDIIQREDSRGLLREDIFSYFETNRNPASGQYQLHFVEPSSCHIYYNGERVDTRTIQTCIADTVTLNGLLFKLNPQIVEKKKIEFKVNPFQSTVENLVAREKIRPLPDGSLMKIVLQDRNPKIAARTVNMLAELFVKKSEDLRRDATRFNRENLEEQLRLVKEDLDRSDYELKSFRSTFLQGLDQETQGTVDRLNDLQIEIRQKTFQKDELSSLVERLNPSSENFDPNVPLTFVYREISGHPVFINDPNMKIAREGLENLNDQKNELVGPQRRPERNPEVLEISEKIFFAEERIREMAAQKIDELGQELKDLSENMKQQQVKLSRLPEEELRYIRLTRERRANESLYTNLLNRLNVAEVTEAIPSERVSIMDPAVPDFRPVSANKRQVFLMFVIGSVFLGLGITLILEMADKSVRSGEDVTHHLSLKILGSIPRVKFDSYELQDSEKAKSISSQIVTHDYSPTPVGEAYRALRTNLLFSKAVGNIRSLVISSAAPGEGKSFTAANLTITLAQQKSKTLLIDADLRRGVLHNTFNCNKKPGLTNYLTGVASLEEVLQETYIPNLTLIACGSMIPNPSELLGSERMKRFVAGITKRFDMIVFDSPPLLAASDAVILGTMVDGVAMVIRTGQTHRDTIKRKLELFQNVQARVLGGVLNCAGIEVAHEGYSYYSY